MTEYFIKHDVRHDGNFPMPHYRTRILLSRFGLFGESVMSERTRRRWDLSILVDVDVFVGIVYNRVASAEFVDCGTST